MLFLLLDTLGMGAWELMHLGERKNIQCACIHTYKYMVYLDITKDYGRIAEAVLTEHTADAMGRKRHGTELSELHESGFSDKDENC